MPDRPLHNSAESKTHSVLSPREAPEAQVDGRYYVDSVPDIQSLKRAGRFEEAVRILQAAVDATEGESHSRQWGVAPWYYEQLAIIYRKQKNPAAELAILERYERQRKAPGAKPAQLAERLRKIRAVNATEASSRRPSTER